MSDKPKYQKEVSEYLGSSLSKLEGMAKISKFVEIGIRILNRNWGKIDKWRMDKFMYLVRTIVSAYFTIALLPIYNTADNHVSPTSKMLLPNIYILMLTDYI